MRGVGPISRSMRVSIRSFFKSSIYAGGGRGDVAGSVDVCGVDVGFIFNLDLRRGSLYSCIPSSVVHVVCQSVRPLSMSLSSIIEHYSAARPSVLPSLHSFIRPSVRPSVRLSVRPSKVRPSVPPSIRQSVRLSVCPSVRPFVHLSVRSSRLSVRSSLCPVYCLSVR